VSAGVRTLVVGTAGHIDHGKSALVRALTGTDPDRLKEEQERGITIDLGFAHTAEGGTVLSFVDVPGHERFVRTMLAGAGGIDAVLLVIAADESVMPQTREHFHICRLLGVRSGVIALSKADLADEEMLALAEMETRELVAGSFLEAAPIVRVSARTGEGLAALRDALATLPDPVRAAADRPARLPIDRVFTIRGFGTVATGTLVAGSIAAEDELQVLPAGPTVKVRGVQVHGLPATRAVAGQRVAVNLSGVNRAELGRGGTLAPPGSLEPSRVLDAAIDLLDDARVAHGARVRVHQGTAEVLGRVALSGVRASASTPGEIPPGGSAFARLRLESPLVVTRGDRLILRAYSPPVTLGGGVVLDPQPPRGGIRTAAGRARFARLDRSAPAADVVRMILEERAGSGVDVRQLVARLGFTATRAAGLMDGLVASGDAVRAGDLWVSAAVAAALGQALVALVEAHHRREPLSDGLPREEARVRAFGRAAPPVFDLVLAGLIEQGRLAGRERLTLAGRQVSLTESEAQAVAALEEAIRGWGLQAGDTAAAATAAAVPLSAAERLVGLLTRRGDVQRVGGWLLHRSALERLVQDVREMKAAGADGIDVATFKTRYGLTRKWAIPLLEFLDRERVTRRVGDRRVIL
jgi:selenocysteine-specific elongation factor